MAQALVEFCGLPPLILFFITSTGCFGRFVLSTIVNQNKEAWLQESKLAKLSATQMEVSAKSKTLYILDYVNLVSLRCVF